VLHLHDLRRRDVVVLLRPGALRGAAMRRARCSTALDRPRSKSETSAIDQPVRSPAPAARSPS
jgi:hypothetical protein